jgi:hypothetical protein
MEVSFMAQTKWWVKSAKVDIKPASSDTKKVEPAKAKTAEPKVEKPADA